MKLPESSELIKANMALDAVKRLEYPQLNRILHRYIKPDNVPVFPLTPMTWPREKLTNSGSGRNVNLLMTNMTFTKAIGSPIYMALDVLNMQIYKNGADVFSFGVVLFECFKLGEAFPKSEF